MSEPDEAVCGGDELPSCRTGPLGRLGFVLRELIDLVRNRGDAIPD